MSEKIKITPTGRFQERGGKNVDVTKCNFVFSEINSVVGDKEKATHIELKEGEKSVGGVTLEECKDPELAKRYIQLRVVVVDPEYQGGNAVLILYEKSIEYAESLSKNLLFDSSLTIGAYKSFKKLEDLGYKIIENPNTKFDGTYYRAEKSWVLRVERKTDEK